MNPRRTAAPRTGRNMAARMVRDMAGGVGGRTAGGLRAPGRTVLRLATNLGSRARQALGARKSEGGPSGLLTRAFLVIVLMGSGTGPDAATWARGGVSNEPSRSMTRDTTPPLPVRFVKRPGPEPPAEEARRADSSSRSSRSSTEDARYGRPIELPAPQDTASEGDDEAESRPARDGPSVTWVVLSSLAIVLGLFFLVVWLARRALPRSAASLPKDVLEVLGRSPLAARHNLQLIRLGRRLLLVSVTPETAETLAEITDADEVNHLASLCRQGQPDSITGSFRQALHQLGSPQQAGDERVGSRSNSLGFGADAGKASRMPLQHVRKTT